MTPGTLSSPDSAFRQVPGPCRGGLRTQMSAIAETVEIDDDGLELAETLSLIGFDSASIKSKATPSTQGCTSVVCMLVGVGTENPVLYCANSGDSRCVFRFVFIFKSLDHLQKFNKSKFTPTKQYQVCVTEGGKCEADVGRAQTVTPSGKGPHRKSRRRCSRQKRHRPRQRRVRIFIQ